MSWIADDWRLKLLALGLAVLLLGAVAFSQNPPTTRSLTVGLNYDTAVGIVILNPPAQTTVTFNGLADVIGSVTSANLTATVDATHAAPGTGVKLDVKASSSVQGVSVQDPPPIVVNIDARATVALPVQVKATAGSGYSLDAADSTCAGTTPCVVHFDGPVSWEAPVGLKAVVIYSPAVLATDIQQPSQPIVLYTNSGPFDTRRVTQPSWTLDISSADIHIRAHSGVTRNTVALVDAPPSNGPPAGYRIVAIDVNPKTIIITGDPAVLSRIGLSITLPAVDLSGQTTTYRATVNIPYPDGVSPVNGVQTATITYTIQRNPSVSPSPSP